MKTYTLQDIENLSPYYPATKHLPLDWTGTLIDILQVESYPHEDRIWVVTQLLDDKTNRLFAVWCAREALKLVDSPDVRSIAACDVAEQYAHGNATDSELKAAGMAGWAADSAAARVDASAAVDAGRAAARVDASAAVDAGRAAARVAVTRTVMAAVEVGAAEAAAGDTDIQQAQIDKLIEMIEELT